MKVLAIIDMQKDFIDGALGTKEAVAIVPKVGLSIDAGGAEAAGAALSGGHGRLADRRGACR